MKKFENAIYVTNTVKEELPEEVLLFIINLVRNLHKEIPEVRDYYAGRSCHGGSGRQCIPEASDCPPAPLLAGSKRTASDRCPERLLVPIRSYAGLCYRCNDPDRSG